MKIGDKVKVKNLEEVLEIEGAEDYEYVINPDIVDEMLKFFGKEGEITLDAFIDNIFQVSLNGEKWFFKKEWLEPIKINEIKNPTYDDLKPLFSDTEPKYVDEVDIATKYDEVEKPLHYNVFEREVIDTIEDLLKNNENYKGADSYYIGNVIKYIFRAGIKDDFKQNIEKARYYLNKILEG